MTKEFQLNKAEYRLLLDLLAIADWVMNSIDEKPIPETRPYRRVLQKFYAMAELFGYTDLVEYDPELKQYFFTAKMGFEEDWMDWVDRFVDASFWEELVYRLAEVHTLRKMSKKKLEEIEEDTYRNLLREARDKYIDEFAENDLENVYVVGVDDLPAKEISTN